MADDQNDAKSNLKTDLSQGSEQEFGDDQGTRIGAPSGQRHASPAQHNDGPTGRPERKLGTGSEPTVSARDTDHDQEHRSGYGGKGGSPDSSSESR